MASPQHFSLLILSLILSLSLLFTPTQSLTCKSQNLPNNRTYANCTDLPSLSATLHYTYTTTNRSLSVAFSAVPPTSSGYVAWGLNPTGPKMAGTQALISFKSSNGVIAVLKYNLSSYAEVKSVKELSFATSDISAVESDGTITIFATVKIPEKADNLSQVWQVGPVNGGVPGKHAFASQNLAATAALPVVVTTAVSGGNTSSSGNTTTSSSSNSNTTTSTGNEKSGGNLVMGERFGLGFYLGLVLVLMGFMSI